MNERDQDQRTPLILCAVVEDERWALSVARLLIENGAKIWLSDKTGKNALMAACLNERVALIDVFLHSLDFNLNAQDKFGCSALHHCAMCGNIEMCRVVLSRLLRYDLPILLHNKDNKTPVECAIELGYIDCAEEIAADARNQKQTWEIRRMETERRRAEERELMLRKFRKPSVVSVVGNVADDATLKAAGLPTVVEGGSAAAAAASYVDAVAITVDTGFDVLNTDSCQPEADKISLPGEDIQEATDMPDSSTPAAVVARPKTAFTHRKLSPSLGPKPASSSTPRILSANKKYDQNNNASVTSVLKQARDREMTAKRQDFRRALSALPNRKRVRESKISFQSRKSGEILLNRPRTAHSTSIVLNADSNVSRSYVMPLFEIYKEHLTDAFRPSVAAIQKAALEAQEQQQKLLLAARDEADSEKTKSDAGRDSVDSNKKSKTKRKASAGKRR